MLQDIFIGIPEKGKHDHRQIWLNIDDPNALGLINAMLTFNPSKRIDACTALRHPFFHDMRDNIEGGFNEEVDEPTCDRPFDFVFESEVFDGSDVRDAMFQEVLNFHPETPVGRTKSSWLHGANYAASAVPIGHTSFSWRRKQRRR